MQVLLIRFLIIFVVLPLSLFSRPYKPQVYDCFMFFNELEILEIRLHEMAPYVDKFVLVESSETHRKGDPKPLYFELNKDRFARFADKIIHIKVEEHFETDNPWNRENWQRNQIMRGLNMCKPADIILISDVDEIVPGKTIPQFKELLRTYNGVVCIHKMYRWFLNRSAESPWAGTGVVRFKDIVRLTPQGVRNAARGNKIQKKVYAGWHFTSMGGYEKIVQKYHSIVEGYDNVIDEKEWRRQVNGHRLVPVSHDFPRFVRENLQYMIDQKLIDLDVTET